jgi:signal transduction histidine kinase
MKNPSEAVPTNVCNLIDDVLRLLSLHTTSKRLSVERRYAWSGDVEVGAEMQKAFWNLLENAVEAAPLKGKMVVRVRAARECRGKRRDGVRIRFADNGLGLDAETKSRLFDPFFSTKERKGRGLGLWIARDIVSRHGGTIRVRSSSRRGFSGTCCSVFLPLEVKSRRKVA